MKKIVSKSVMNTLRSYMTAGVLVFLFMFGGTAYAKDEASEVGKKILDNFDDSSGAFKTFLIGNNVQSVVGTVVSAILALMGLIFLILMVYGGIKWMTAEGDENKVATARGVLFHAAIGLIIVLSAYAITAFVLGRLVASIP